MRSLAVALCLVLAGCGGVAAPTPESEPTVTPAPVPEDPRGTDDLAPGLSRGGVFDAGRLAAAHAEALSGRSFTRVRTDLRSVDGTVTRRDETILGYAEGGSRFLYRLNQTDRREGRARESRIVRYADGERVYVASTRDGVTTYSVLRGPGGEFYDPARVFPENGTGESALARLLVLVDVRVTDERTVDGATVYRVATDERQDIPPLEDIRLAANVTRTGLVRDYRVSYDVDRGGRTVRVVATVEYRDVGGTVVDAPGWLGATERATGVESADGTEGAAKTTGTRTPTEAAAG
jgi:hypothetical protein